VLHKAFIYINTQQARASYKEKRKESEESERKRASQESKKNRVVFF
jgi:hypothetical protein